ncbi:MAG: YihA family ribosome biogenesis GTP-binding protein [Bacteroidales bacterium]|nr:YihA family ribosome biogenesis GTP-binding protein [Bacteroidales bacterium]
MEVRKVKFIKSSPDLKSCPKAGLPEYAFAGRSNVGKSSLINMLVNLKNMAKTSSLPGKTRMINHYLVNDQWYLADLPGYGYARAGSLTQHAFIHSISEYLLNRENLVCLFLLIDCRHKPLKNDLNIMAWLGMHKIPFVLVFTKTDKITAGILERNLEYYRQILLEAWEEVPVIFTASSVKHSGRNEILDFIDRTGVNI